MVATLERIARVEAIPLSPIQTHLASKALARTFQNDPVFTDLIPNEGDRLNLLETLWSGVVTYCLGFGEVYSTPGVLGAACWLSPDNTEMSMWGNLRTRMALPRAVMLFSGAARKRIMAALDYLDEVRRQEMKIPHWYLWVLGVDPPHQGQGIASALVAPVMERASESGIPCYAETMDVESLVFYKQLGFQVARIGLAPGINLPVWALKTG